MNESLPKLNKFQCQRILSLDPLTKLAAITGIIGDDTVQEALVVIEPIPFQSDQLESFVQNADLDMNLHNDAYSSYTATAVAKFQVQLTYPATSKHIDKFIQQKDHRVLETAHLYNKTVLPYINSIGLDRIQWVRNILQGRSEQDRIIYNDPDPVSGFILLPDIKWDASNVENLYIQAIARDSGIRSLRDLGMQHLPLLKNILEKGISAIVHRYLLDPSLLRSYVHYHPSYYHFHVHFVHSALTTSSCFVGRAILLEDIIENIQLCGTYYQERTLCYYLPENHDLYKVVIADGEISSHPIQ